MLKKSKKVTLVIFFRKCYFHLSTETTEEKCDTNGSQKPKNIFWKVFLHFVVALACKLLKFREKIRRFCSFA